MTCREWLRENGYQEVVDLIDAAMTKMATRGSKQRRNWWDILAGGPNGKPCVREGIEFPVLRIAQIRQGIPVTPNAISVNEDEQPPDVIATKRWPRKKLPPKLRRETSPTSRADLPGHAKAS
jgi:hypothetical protein